MPEPKPRGGRKPRGQQADQLTVQQLRCAQMLAERVKTQPEIAATLGVSVRTIVSWGTLPQVVALIADIQKSAEDQVKESAIASVAQRVKARNKRWTYGTDLIEQRREHFKDSDVLELRTGLYVPSKLVRYDKDGNPVSERTTARHDSSLLTQLHNDELLTARDLGQHVEHTKAKVEHSGPGGGPIQIDARATAGYVMGTVADAAMYFTALIRAGRVKTGREDLAALAREINDRIEANRLGLETPPLTEPYALPEVKED